jgi:hypothetical protein
MYLIVINRCVECGDMLTTGTRAVDGYCIYCYGEKIEKNLLNFYNTKEVMNDAKKDARAIKGRGRSAVAAS